jgi:drug/metabolite transporter (DMT)-like permease
MSNNKLVGLPLYGVMLGMLLTGTANTILMKIQDFTSARSDPTQEPTKYNHPYFQCSIMFLGEFLCLGMYGIKLLVTRHRNKGVEPVEVLMSPGASMALEKKLKTNINPLLLAIPASCDVIASTLMNIALTMVAASVYQMLRGIIVLIVAAMAIIFLKRKLYIHHYSSLACIFLGVFLVGLASLTGEQAEGQEVTEPLGIILLIIAQLFAGALFVVEEKLLGDYYLDPLKIVGLEGLWGLIIWCIILPILQNIHCTSPQLCPSGLVEDTLGAFRQWGDNPIIILQCVGICLSIAFFNAFGVTVTKHASSPQRSTIDTSRTVLIWIFFLAVPVNGNYTEHFKGLQLGGFFLLVLGTLVYNEILIIPFLGFNANTRIAIAKRE